MPWLPGRRGGLTDCQPVAVHQREKYCIMNMRQEITSEGSCWQQNCDEWSGDCDERRKLRQQGSGSAGQFADFVAIAAADLEAGTTLQGK